MQQYKNMITGFFESITGKNGAVNTRILESDIQQPVEIQGVYTEQEKTLSAASVGAGATVNFTTFPVAMISDKGNFTRFSTFCVASASHTYSISPLPSPDGVVMGAPMTTVTSASTSKVINGMDSVLDYIVYQINNADTVTRTYDVYTRKFN